MFESYVSRVCAEIEQAAQTADQMGGLLDRTADTIYFGKISLCWPEPKSRWNAPQVL
jgi:hypothetical protein